MSLVEEILLSLTQYKNKFELILVNDSSTDSTLKIINEIKNLNSKIVKVINNKNNLGQSYSIIEGIKFSSFNTIVTLDGDGQNNPKDIESNEFDFLERVIFFLITERTPFL